MARIVDGQTDLVHMLHIARLRTLKPELIDILLAKHTKSLANRFIGSCIGPNDPMDQEQRVEITLAEVEAVG
jgi:hypothetical protein